jgi:hypothetical protein
VFGGPLTAPAVVIRRRLRLLTGQKKDGAQGSRHEEHMLWRKIVLEGDALEVINAFKHVGIALSY